MSGNSAETTRPGKGTDASGSLSTWSLILQETGFQEDYKQKLQSLIRTPLRSLMSLLPYCTAGHRRAQTLTMEKQILSLDGRSREVFAAIFFYQRCYSVKLYFTQQKTFFVDKRLHFIKTTYLNAEE